MDMNRVILTVFLIIILGGLASAGDEYKHSELYDFELSNPQQLYKSESFGLQLAFFPGVLVHGMGHMYSGHTGKGLLLFLSELTGVLMIIGDNIDPPGFQYSPPPDPPESDPDPENIPIDFSGNYDEGGTGILTYIGAAMFLGSWIYDCVKTPLLVREYNDRIDQKYEALSLSLEPDLKRKTIMLNLNFSF